MASRVWPRLYVMARGAAGMAPLRRRQPPTVVRRLLIAQHLLLGDTIMLTPLIKKARKRFPDAEIVVTCRKAYAPIYAGRPYGVKALGFDPRSLSDHMALRKQRGFDLALVPGDNRWSWLARALDARWIVAFAADEASYKDWPVDEMRAMPQEPMAWGEIASCLLDGENLGGYSVDEWPAPDFSPYSRPQAPYCVLHLGASNFHKLWPPERWQGVRDWAESRGYQVVLSVGSGEEALLAPVDPDGTRSGLAARLDLAQMWDLLRNAAFLVCPTPASRI